MIRFVFDQRLAYHIAYDFLCHGRVTGEDRN